MGYEIRKAIRLPTKPCLLNSNCFGLSLSCQSLLYFFHSLHIRLRQSIQQAIRAGFERLGNSGERDDREWILAVFQITDRLPVNSHQFSQAFLRDASFEAGRFHVPTNQPQNLTIRHPSVETTDNCLLTSNMFDNINISYLDAVPLASGISQSS